MLYWIIMELLRNNTISQLWYETAPYLENNNIKPPYAIEDIKKLLKKEDGELDALSYINDFLEHRGYQHTCKKAIEEGKLPNPDGASFSPIIAEAEYFSREHLDAYSRSLSSSESKNRGYLGRTSDYKENIKLRLNFVANIKKERVNFAGIRVKKNIEKIPINLIISTEDIPGEDFTSTVEQLGGKEVNKIKCFHD